MSRGLPTGMAAALAAAHVTQFVMVEMLLDSGALRLAGTPCNIEWGGYTWTAAHNLGTVEAIIETATDQRGLAFTLGGLPPSIVSTVLSEPVQGRLVRVLLAVVDNGTLIVDDAAWSGVLDTMTLQDTEQSATVRVTAEHRLVAWREAALLRFSHEDQQRLAAGDKFFEYAAQVAEATIVWPNKEFFRQ